MFRVRFLERPSVNKIHKKYFFILNKLVEWAKASEVFYKVDIYAVYLRGSVAYGKATKSSDLDVVIIFSWLSEYCTIQMQNFFSRLLKLYVTCYYIDIKIMNVDKNREVELSAELDRSRDLQLKKYVNFDIFANGVCFFGKEIKDQSTVYSSVEEFREVNQRFWGQQISYLTYWMHHSSCFNDYYSLIKRCIRLAAYINFTQSSLYCCSVEKCYETAIQSNPSIIDQLCILYDALYKPLSNIEELKVAINIVVNTIVNPELAYPEAAEK